MQRSNVTVWWTAPRAQSVDECADLVARLLSALAEIDPTLTGWRNGGRSKRQALAQPLVTLDHADLVQRLLDGRRRGDFEKQVIESLGYSLRWWNGADDNRAGAQMSFHLASSSLRNSMTLDMPQPDAVPSLYRYDTASKLLHTLVHILSPDTAWWSHSGLLEKQSEPDRPTPDGRGYIAGNLIGQIAGWANYLSDSYSVKFNLALLPANAIIERVAAGTLVTVGHDPADPPLEDVLQLRRAMGYVVPHSLTATCSTQH